MHILNIIQYVSKFLDQTLCCDHLLESYFQDDSNEWSQHKVWLRNKHFRICDTHLIWSPELIPFEFCEAQVVATAQSLYDVVGCNV